MCGTGTLPIESAMEYPNCFNFGGDIHVKSVEQTFINAKYSLAAIAGRYLKTSKENSCRPSPVEVLRWDATRFPMRDNIVDVIVCDMPFGRRSGSNQQNCIMYPKIIAEMYRVLKPNGVMVLLTLEKKLLDRVLRGFTNLPLVDFISIYMGGLKLILYKLQKIPKNN